MERREFLEKSTKGLAGIIGFGSLSRLLTGCSKREAKEYRNIKGQIYQLSEKTLTYVDGSGFGSSNSIKVPISFLGVESEGKTYQFILTGPHNLKTGDSIDLDYLVDIEITSKEIWDRFYPGRGRVELTEPNVRFKADGYAHSWKKE